MYIGGGRILENQVKKHMPCIGRAISFSTLSFMLLFLTIVGILPSAEGKEKNIVFFFIIIFFLVHVLFVLYSLLKLNSPIYLVENKMSQKQFGQLINIEYDKISDAKLSFAYYIRAPYAIKVYENDKMMMFEITSKVYDEFMKYCSNIEIKNKIERLLKEKDIY